MAVVILVIHLMIAIALVASVLLQRSEGGALGIGGGGGGVMSGRGVANALTRTTTILAFAFFVTSITLTLLARNAEVPSSIFDGVAPIQQTGEPATGGAPTGAILPNIGVPNTSGGPEVPVSQ